MRPLLSFALAALFGASLHAMTRPGPLVVAGASPGVEMAATLATAVSGLANVAWIAWSIRREHRAERAARRPSIDRPDIAGRTP